MPPTIIDLLVFSLTLLVCLALYQAFSNSRNSVESRLAVDSGETPTRTLPSRFFSLVQWSAGKNTDFRPRTPFEQKLDLTLARAGFRRKGAVALFVFLRSALMIGLALLAVSIGALFGKSLLGAAAVGCLLGYALPTFVVERIARNRRRRIFRELPDLLALMVVSLEAGIGIAEVVKLVGIETERQGRVMGAELSATAAQMEAGRGLEDSLHDLGERTGVDEVKSLVALIVQSERVGASLAPALRASADLLNSRRKLAAEESAHKTAVQMLFPLIFLILPAMMLIVLGPAVLQISRIFGWTK